MTAHKDADPRPPSDNLFATAVSQPYWQQRDFVLACISALLLWPVFKFFDLPIPVISTAPLAYTLLLFIFVFPILEEIVFRGLVQESIQQLLANTPCPKQIIWRIGSANILASTFFSLSHFWAHSAGWAIASFVPSLVFGYFKDRYQSLSPSITLHIFYNLVFYLLLWRWP